jgi:hypothetical protein
MSERNLTQELTQPPVPIPDSVKLQIETVLLYNSKKKYKMKVSEFAQQFIDTHKFILNPKTFGYDSLVSLLSSLTDRVYVELTRVSTGSSPLGSTDIYDEYARFDVGLILCIYPHRVYPDVAHIDKDLTREGKVRSRRVVFFELDELNAVDHFAMYLFDADDRIYVHWSQAARLFGLRPAVFKAIVLADSENTKTFQLDEFNGGLFDLVERKLGIDLTKTDEADDIHFVVYDRLRALSDAIFDSNSSSRRKVNVYITKLWLREEI